MKKFVLFFAVATVTMTMTGCDGFCTNDYVIINQTKSEVLVEMDWLNKQITIEQGKEQSVHHEGHACSPNGDAKKYNDDVKILYANMQIDSATMPDIIWTAKYWEYSSDGKSHGIYTLTVTDELIETILSEVEDKSE